jgi:hypothetical protein
MRCERGPSSPTLVAPLAVDIPEIVIPVGTPSGAGIRWLCPSVLKTRAAVPSVPDTQFAGDAG